MSRTILCIATLLSGISAANAQEFRIYTRIYDLKASRTSPPVVARSLTLFHAGKVYDYIDVVGEVTVFEPSHNRFVLLNARRKAATRIELSQVAHLLKLAREEWSEHLQKVEKDGKSSSQQAEWLRFQLEPKLDEHFDAAEKRVTLSSALLRYDARCSAVESADVAEAYRRFADAVSRLNYVMHPRHLLPGARLALNASLRRRKLVPQEVVLRTFDESSLHLKAEHRIHWKLDARDRALIHQWESQLKDRTTRWTDLRNYQQLHLLGQRTSRR